MHKTLAYLLILLYILALSFGIWQEDTFILQLCFLIIPVTVGSVLFFTSKRAFIALTIFLIPISITTNFGRFSFAIGFPSELMLAALLIPIWIYIAKKPYLSKRILLHPISLVLLADLLWMCIATLFSSMPMISLKRVFMRFAFLSLFYLVLAHEFRNPKQIINVFLLYTTSLTIVIAYSTLRHLSWGFSPKVSSAMPQPFYDDHTIYGAAIAFVIPFCLVVFYNAKLLKISSWQKLFLLGLLIVLTLGEILSSSRAAWLSLVIVVGFYLLLKLNIRMLGLMTITIISLGLIAANSTTIYNTLRQNKANSAQDDLAAHVQSVTNIQTDDSNLERINRWICAYRMFEDRPLLGFGPGTYQFQYGRYQVYFEMTRISTYHGDKGKVHSEYLTYLCELGLPGFLIFLTILLTTLVMAMELYYNPPNPAAQKIALALGLSLITYFVHGLFNDFIDQDKASILVFGSLAALTALYQQYPQKQPTP